MTELSLVGAAKNPAISALPRRARIATALMFAAHATLFASWTAHVPLIKHRLGLDTGELGLALLGAALGSVASMLLTGAAISRWGSRIVVLCTCVPFGLTAVGVPLAGSAPLLFAALFLWGAAYGALDVAMNAQAITVERRYGRPILSSFHACWSLGALAGSGIGIAAVSQGITLTTQFAVLGTAMALAGGVLIGPMLTGDGSAEPMTIVFPIRDRRLLALGAIILTGLLCEGAAADWTAVYLTDRLHTGPGTAGAGYVAFAVAMLAGRTVGDRLVATLGGVTVVRTLATIAAVGLGLGLLIGTTGAALAGFATLGLGLAVVVPVVYSAAAALPGRQPGHSIAAISTCGWFGFMIGPPLIGLLADASNLSIALLVLPVLAVGIALSAGTLHPSPAATPP